MSNGIIDDILDNFDFERVKKVMDAIEWVYWDSPDKQITIAELRKMARKLLNVAYSAEYSDHYCTGSGGFEVERWLYPGDTNKYFSLKFVVTEWYNVD